MKQYEIIKVTPIYGYGWFIAGEMRFEPPKPFTVKLKRFAPERWKYFCEPSIERYSVLVPERWEGVVLDTEHEFKGRDILLQSRHAPWSGDVTIIIKPSSGAKTDDGASGFGMLEKKPFLRRS